MEGANSFCLCHMLISPLLDEDNIFILCIIHAHRFNKIFSTTKGIMFLLYLIYDKRTGFNGNLFGLSNLK